MDPSRCFLRLFHPLEGSGSAVCLDEIWSGAGPVEASWSMVRISLIR